MLSFVSKFRVPHPQQYFPVLSCFSIMEKFDISPVAPAAAAAAAAPAAPAGLILNVTYFSCLFMSNISPIATSDRRSESLSLNLDQICVCS